MVNRSEFESFESRKQDHIAHCLKDIVDAQKNSLGSIQLIHEALPDLNFSELSTETKMLDQKLGSPIFVSSMTAGHNDSLKLNEIFASACCKKNWLFAVGSQRRELIDKNAHQEWSKLRQKYPQLKMIANIGVAQLIETKIEQLEVLVTSTQALALIVHLNSLQEVIQAEGTPNFKGGFDKIKTVAEKLSVPLIVKETGCGFSLNTLEKLTATKIHAVDISGYGGTHWGRVEGERLKGQSDEISKRSVRASQVFVDWGESTLSSMMSAITLKPKYNLWASGGVRSGLDVAKLIAMGASAVGLARPFLLEALKGETFLEKFMSHLEHELKIAMFCTGSSNLKELGGKWKWISKN